MIGRTLGPYHVIDKLGEGGMGEVYRARDTRLKREVALKVLPQALSSDPDRLVRFAREAEMLAALNHPNIAAIYGLEEVEDTPATGACARALVMELVEGETLAARLARGPLAVDEALAIARQIAAALEVAHEQGIIHRDLKPANIKVRPEGTVKVLDFGLARVVDVETSAASNVTMSPTITSPAVTQAGIILGTAAYMSPEQAKGKALDRRTDIWSFGVVLFELVAGSRPFAGEEISDVLASVLARDPQFELLPADVPASIRQLLRALLQKDPRRRLHHMADVRLMLDGALDLPASSPRADGTATQVIGSRKRTVALAALFAGCLAVGAAAGWLLKPGLQREPASFVHPLREQRFTRPGRTLLAISPDATLAYVADEQIFTKARDELVARPLPGTAGEDPASPSFSPDGRSVAYWAKGEIKRIPVSGGTSVRLAEALIPTGLSWGADGTIVYAQNDGIWRVTDRGTEHEQIIVAADGERMQAPQTLPGGDAILFSVTREAGAEAWDEASIVVESLRTRERTPVHRGANPRFVPATGHLLYVTGQTLFAIRFDPGSLKTDGAPIPLVRGIQRSMGPPAGLAQYGISEGGALAYIGRSGDVRTDLELIARSGESRILLNSSGASYYPRMSPDESRVAVQRGTGDEAEVWIYDIGRSAWQPLTDGARPVWNPITNAITFLRDDELWEIPLGGGPARPLQGTRVARNRGPYDWSPGGDVLLYGSPTGIRAFYPNRAATDAAQRPEVVVAPEGDSADYIFASFSPDGRAFAMVAVDRREGAPSLYVAPYPFVPGSQRRLTFSASVGPTWRRGRNGSADELFAVRGNLLYALPIAETSPVPRMLNAAPAFPYSLSRVFSEGGSPNYDLTRDGHILTTSSIPAAEINVILNWVEDLRRAGQER